MVATALLKQPDLDGRSREGVVQINRAAGRMMEMIASLLDFADSRFREALPISPVRTDLHEVTRGVVEELRAANAGCHIDVAIGGDGRGRWDPARMAQVVSNLVGNAITHGARGEPVRVSLDGDADALRLTVWNAGPPIPPELRPVLFEPFRRGAAARCRGLGLGLYIVKQIVTAHGGEVDVHSSVEDGTTFAVRVPRWGAGARDRQAARGHGASL
jgi:signal transduction histidine kinase